MAKVYVIDFDGGTAAQYDAMTAALDLGGVLPPGARFHTAGPSPTGWRVIDCWDDPHAFARFAAERIRPLAEQAGMRPPRVKALDVAGGMTGHARPPEVAVLGRLPGVDGAAFRALQQKALDPNEAPAGMIHHVNGPYESGWYVVGVWETEAQRARFVAERVLPLVPPGAGEPVFEVLPIHNAIVERATTRA